IKVNLNGGAKIILKVISIMNMNMV
ncbi:uncharacterized protein METZ01_LOCUS272577, partial [marine metagenome]